jgi:hypothetical protein
MRSTLTGVAPTVLAKLINRLADLHAWRRSPDGQWWALVSWELYGQLRGGNGHLHCSAWMPASTMHRTSNPEDDRKYPDVPRLGLPDDLHAWPTLAPRHGTRCHSYGRLIQRPDPPPGISVFTGGYPPRSPSRPGPTLPRPIQVTNQAADAQTATGARRAK